MTDATNPSAILGSVRIRPAVHDDIGALTQLINSAFRVEQPFIDGDRVDSEKVRMYMTTGDFLLAEDSAGLAGCVYAEIREDRGYAGLFSVDPRRQSRGLGRKLMDAVENFFREAGCCGVDLRVVSARTPLPSFYRHLGYLETGTAPFQPGVKTKTPCHYILMSKPLV